MCLKAGKANVSTMIYHMTANPKNPRYKDGDKVTVLEANEADERYIGKTGRVIGECTNWDVRTWYYKLEFDEYYGDDSNDDPPYFVEEELTLHFVSR